MARLPNPRWDYPGWYRDWHYGPSDPACPDVDVYDEDDVWLYGPDGRPLARPRRPFGFHPSGEDV